MHYMFRAPRAWRTGYCRVFGMGLDRLFELLPAPREGRGDQLVFFFAKFVVSWAWHQHARAVPIRIMTELS